MGYFSSFRGYRGKKRLLAPNSKKKSFFNRFKRSYFDRFKSTSHHYSNTRNSYLYKGKYVRGKTYFNKGKKYKTYYNFDYDRTIYTPDGSTYTY